jgi:transposase
MRKGRPLTPLLLVAGDRAQLVAWSKRPKTAQALAMRSRIVLLAADGLSNTAIASRLHTMQHTVGKWRRRYLESGLDGLVDEPRPGTSNKLSDQDVERVLALTLESAPADATHWSTRSMAKRAGLSRASIHRIWQAFSLAPHRSETFKLSKDPLFIDKVRDIVGLYLAPRNAHWCYASMKRARYKLWTEPHHYCPCVPDRSNAARTIMPVTAPPVCSLPWTPKPVH